MAVLDGFAMRRVLSVRVVAVLVPRKHQTEEPLRNRFKVHNRSGRVVVLFEMRVPAERRCSKPSPRFVEIVDLAEQFIEERGLFVDQHRISVDPAHNFFLLHNSPTAACQRRFPSFGKGGGDRFPLFDETVKPRQLREVTGFRGVEKGKDAIESQPAQRVEPYPIRHLVRVVNDWLAIRTEQRTRQHSPLWTRHLPRVKPERFNRRVI